jgi:tetratricopeptide (TPR) repeat protein
LVDLKLITEDQNMKTADNIVRKLLEQLLLGAVIFSASAVANNSDTVAELIEEAHKYDNMWATSQDANRQSALKFYNAALGADPDEDQRLHIIYRMAQLYGSAYQLEKDEKPDFRKAIELNKQILDSYPFEEPLVFKAMISIGDHHITLWEFEDALKYFGKALEYNVSELEQHLASIIDDEEQENQIITLKSNIARIKQYQIIAVNQAEYAATLIHPICAKAVLQNVAGTHSNSFIGEHAAERLEMLANNMDEMLDLQTPILDMEMITGKSDSAVSAAQGETIVNLQKSIQISPANDVNTPTERPRPREGGYIAEHSRDSPSRYHSKSIVGVAVFITIGLAAFIIRKKETLL